MTTPHDKTLSYSPRKPKWAWRDFLTDEEREILRTSDEAKDAWLKLNARRASIQNRAIQRAKYAAQKDSSS